MHKLIRYIIILLCFLCGSVYAQFLEDDPELDMNRKPLPPYSIRKVHLDETFTPFEFIDLNGRTWTNRNELTRPFLIITGKWALRHDIKIWAHYLSYKYLNFCDIIWVFNPDSTEFANHREENEKLLKSYAMAIPVVIDSHAIIGRSLRLDYDIPTLIGINRHNRLGFVYESPCNEIAKQQLQDLMLTRLFK